MADESTNLNCIELGTILRNLVIQKHIKRCIHATFSFSCLIEKILYQKYSTVWMLLKNDKIWVYVVGISRFISLSMELEKTIP